MEPLTMPAVGIGKASAEMQGMENEQTLMESIQALLAELDMLGRGDDDAELRQLCRNAIEGLRPLAEHLQAQPAEHGVTTASPTASPG
jgi:hypothetical protein